MTEQVKAPTLPHTLEANLKQYFRKLGAWRIVLALALTALLYLRFGLLVWILSVVGLAAIIGIILFFLARRRLMATDTGLEYTNPFGRVRKITYGEIETAKVFVNFYEPSFGAMPRVSIGMQADVSPIVLSGMYWPLEGLDALLAILNDKKVVVESTAEVVMIKHITTYFPKYATYAERHTIMLATLIV
ncbi:MAG: hypothetical protein ACREGE_02500, partial [Candidatus Microsaccharimonas sp.]